MEIDFDAMDIIEHARLVHNAKKALVNRTKSRTFGYDLPFEQYLQIICNLSSQSYGPRIQNRLIDVELHDVVKSVKSKEDKGDALGLDDSHIEIKVTCLDVNGRLHIVQVRPYQKDIKFYLLVIIKPDLNYSYDLLLIPHRVLHAIIKIYGGLAHGTKSATINNENKEYRATLKYSSKIVSHLLKKYGVNDFITLRGMIGNDKQPFQHKLF